MLFDVAKTNNIGEKLSSSICFAINGFITDFTGWLNYRQLPTPRNCWESFFCLIFPQSLPMWSLWLIVTNAQYSATFRFNLRLGKSSIKLQNVHVCDARKADDITNAGPKNSLEKLYRKINKIKHTSQPDYYLY